MIGRACGLAALLSTATALATPILIDPTVSINGTAKGTAAAGKAPDGTPTPADDVKDAQGHAAEYDGPTTFTADYTIVRIPNDGVDKTKSSVVFKTTSYTAGGGKNSSDFTTRAITITDVKFNDDGSVASFTFQSTDWYPASGEGASGLTNNGLSGSIDLKTGASSYKASYIDKSNGAVYTYDVSGTIGPAGGGGGGGPPPKPVPGDDEIDDIFTPFDDATVETPEPASVLLLLGGLSLVASVNRRK
jgi:hypothetical protein